MSEAYLAQQQRAPGNPDTLTSALLAVLPPESVRTTNVEHEIDGLAPALVVEPATIEDVSATLRLANEHGAAVVPWGSGLHQGLGQAPARYDIALGLCRLNSIVEYEPADLTVTVEAGVKLDDLQRTLAAHGQWLPLDPPYPGATIGGILATNASGPSRLAYGTARDLLIGIRFVTAAGDVVKAGGRVVKNVAGYDLGRLQIGALGTLGVIVAASFKVRPLPSHTERLWASSADLEALLATCLLVRDASLAVDSLSLLRQPNDGLWTLALRLAGGAAAVERSRRELETRAPGLHFDTTPPSTDEGTAEPDVAVRCSIVPARVGALLEARALQNARLEAYPNAGVIRAGWHADEVSAAPIEELRALCRQHQGVLVIERAPAGLKQAVDPWGAPGPDFFIMQRLKHQFDPNAVLNPGRFIGGL